MRDLDGKNVSRHRAIWKKTTLGYTEFVLALTLQPAVASLSHRRGTFTPSRERYAGKRGRGMRALNDLRPETVQPYVVSDTHNPTSHDKKAVPTHHSRFSRRDGIFDVRPLLRQNNSLVEYHVIV